MNYDDNNNISNDTTNNSFGIPQTNDNNTYQVPIYREEPNTEPPVPVVDEKFLESIRPKEAPIVNDVASNPQQQVLQELGQVSPIQEEPVSEEVNTVEKPELVPSSLIDEKFLESIKPEEEPESNKSFIPNFDVSISDKKEAMKLSDDDIKSKETINTLMTNYSTNLYQNGPRVYAVPKQKTNWLGVIILTIIVLAVSGYFIYTFMETATKKLVCESASGNITIKYNKQSVIGYTSDKITYDLYEQRLYADEIGIEKYLNEFEQWFKDNTQGSCKR